MVTQSKSPFGSIEDVKIDKLAAQVTLTSADTSVLSSIKQTSTKQSTTNKVKKSGI